MNPGRKWFARLIVASNLLIACAMIFADEWSTMYRTLVNAGPTGIAAISALIAVGMMALVDVVVNDIMPARYVIQFVKSYRHTIYMLMSLGCLSVIFVIVKLYGPSLVLLHYVFVAVVAIFIAVFDIRDKIKEHLRC